MAGLRNSVTSVGPLNRPHTYKGGGRGHGAARHDPDHGRRGAGVQVQTAASTTAGVTSTTFDVPLDTRVKERASGGLPLAPTLLRLALVAPAQVPGMWGPVRIAAFATTVHKGWITRPDRPDLSAVRPSFCRTSRRRRSLWHAGDHASCGPPSASRASPPALRRASAASTSPP